MKAAHAFRAAFRAFYDPPPGAPASVQKVLRLVASGGSRVELIKALAWIELAPENRRPFVKFDADFTDEQSYLQALAEHVRADYDAVRAGLAEEGVALPSIPSDAQSAAAVLAAASAGVAPPLDGLQLALLPKFVSDAKRLERVVASLAPSDRLRIAVLDLEGEPLAASHPKAARMAIDQAALFEYLRTLGAKPSKGPPTDLARASPRERRDAEEKTGKRLASEDAGNAFRALIFDASKALSENKPKIAIKKLRAARTLCALDGLALEEATTTVALGSAYFAAGDRPAALRVFGEARALADIHGVVQVAVQALLGMAGALFADRRFEDAHAAYEEVAARAEEMPEIVTEARRMQAECKKVRA